MQSINVSFLPLPRNFPINCILIVSQLKNALGKREPFHTVEERRCDSGKCVRTSCSTLTTSEHIILLDFNKINGVLEWEKKKRREKVHTNGIKASYAAAEGSFQERPGAQGQTGGFGVRKGSKDRWRRQ